MTVTARNDSAGANLLTPPSDAAQVALAPDFGKRVLLTVDTEEEFDWSAPFRRDGYGLDHVPQIARFQSFCEELGAHPVYLVDWPIAQDERAQAIIGDAVKRKAACIGVQLHSWVNPPFEEAVTTHNSYAGNLPVVLETAKFEALLEAVTHGFGEAPLIYRAGRYGVGPATAQMLIKAGLRIDTSVRSLFDYSAQGGPDFSRHPAHPYWADASRELLELPVTSVYDGVLRRHGPMVHRLQRHIPTFFAGLSRTGLLERLPLTPEGTTIDEAKRAIDLALDDGLSLLVASFHSPSLSPGNTPYTPDEAAVAALYDWLRAIFAHLDQRGVTSTTVPEIIAASDQARL
ncbi:MAG: polysaccharide deacetylase family protein [Pseudomonadota bacterium]